MTETREEGLRPNGENSQNRQSKQNKQAYSLDGLAPLYVAEALAEYAISKQQQGCQGEYTVEDYLVLPKEQRVELIDGELYDMASPSLTHQTIGFRVCQAFTEYIDKHHGTCMAFVTPVDVQLDCDDRTMVQPDASIVCDPSKFRDGRIYGAPDLIVEILSPSTSKKDRTLKLSKYKRAGVREYWIVDPDREKVLVYQLEKGDAPVIYGFADTIPVGIYGGEYTVDFAWIEARLRLL